MSTKDIREKVVQIEQAIKRLDSLRKQLRKDAADVNQGKAYARMSHMVGLLGQVDQTLEVKEEALQIQIVRMNQALGVLQAGLPVNLNEPSEKELADAVEMLKKIQLTSEEPLFNLSKTSDFNLAESIHKYSTVGDSCLPLVNTIDFPENVSAFFSSQLDEFEDVKHQTKSVDAVKQVQRSTSNVSFEMPELSNCLEDWLQKVPSSNAASKDASVFTRFRPAPYPSLLIKPAGRLSGDIPSAHAPAGACSPDADCKGQRDCLQSVRKNLKSWLSHGSGAASSFSDSLFKHIPTDKRMWLRQAFWQMNSLKELKDKDFFQHISKEPSSWLQTRAYIKKSVQTQGSQDAADFFSHIKKDTACWLLKQNKSQTADKIEQKGNRGPERSCDANNACCGKTCGVKEERWLSAASKANTSVHQIKDVCRANELCKNLSECVSQPNCLTMWFEENSSVKNQAVPMEIAHSMSSPLNEWLSPAVQKHTDCSSLGKGAKVTSDLFHHIRAADDPMWLMKSSSSTDFSTAPSPQVRFKVDKEETNLWLQKASCSSPTESGPSDEGLRSGSTSSDADWLMVTEEDKNKHLEMAESEGWSVCSDSHSVSTDQHDKNIAVADEYFSKWLMLQ